MKMCHNNSNELKSWRIQNWIAGMRVASEGELTDIPVPDTQNGSEVTKEVNLFCCVRINVLRTIIVNLIAENSMELCMQDNNILQQKVEIQIQSYVAMMNSKKSKRFAILQQKSRNLNSLVANIWLTYGQHMANTQGVVKNKIIKYRMLCIVILVEVPQFLVCALENAEILDSSRDSTLLECSLEQFQQGYQQVLEKKCILKFLEQLGFIKSINISESYYKVLFPFIEIPFAANINLNLYQWFFNRNIQKLYVIDFYDMLLLQILN